MKGGCDLELKEYDIINGIVDGKEWKGCIVMKDEDGRLYALKFPQMKKAYIKEVETAKGKRVVFETKKNVR